MFGQVTVKDKSMTKKKKTIHHYRKTLVALLGVVLTGLNVQYGTDPSVQLAINLAVVAGVYSVPNKKA